MSTAGDADNFLRELAAGFERAACQFLAVRTLRLGQRRVALHFASEPLLRSLLPAFACVDFASDADGAELAIRIWDTESTSVEPPRPPWSPEHIGARGEIEGFAAPPLRAAFNLHSLSLSVVDARARLGYFWTRSARVLPGYERATPLRTVLAWGVQAWHSEFAHAACVANGSRGALLVGKGGSGKSTCALGCLGSSLRYVSDDYCLLSLATAQPEASALYATAKLESKHLNARLPHLPAARVLREPGEEKSIVYLERDALVALRAAVKLEALVLPQIVSGGKSELRPCSAAAALAALAPSSLFQIPGLGQDSFRFLAEVARKLPCYTLSLGPDLALMRQALWTLLS